MNTIDYLDWRGDLSFRVSPFNEVDNLILSHLAYVKMDGLVSDQPFFSKTLKEVSEAYEEAGYDQSQSINDPKLILTKAASTVRFSDAKVGFYQNIFHKENSIQFCAVSFLLDDGTIFVSYRGTDDTLVGWREDCNFIFMESSPGQDEAVAYLEELASKTACPLRLGGHSKGGNFAVYAASFCDRAISQNRILKIYSNDGPGFNQHRLNSEGYLAVVDKIEKIIPEGSMVGILLASQEKMRLIDSDAKGVDQHNPYSWCVLRDHFVPAKNRTFQSIYTDSVLKQWVDAMDIDQRINLVNTVFDSMEASGYTRLSEILNNPWVTYNGIMKALQDVDPAIRNDVQNSLKILAGLGKNTLWNEAKKKFEQIDDKLPLKEKIDDYKDKIDDYKDKIDTYIDKIDDMIPFIKLRDEEKRAEKKEKKEEIKREKAEKKLEQQAPGILMSNPTELLSDET